MPVKVMLVDDEPLAVQRLQRLMAELPEYSVCAVASDGNQALLLARQCQPDIVLLDIAMPGVDGLAVAAELTAADQPPAIIFCTAYDEHALAAFAAAASDYLLKPVNQQKLQQALERACRPNRAQRGSNELAPPVIAVNSDHGQQLVPLAAVCCFVADNKLTRVVYPQGEGLIDLSLTQLQQRFGDSLVRVHRNALVAVAAVATVRNDADGTYLCLHQCSIQPRVSRRHLPELRRRLRQFALI